MTVTADGYGHQVTMTTDGVTDTYIVGGTYVYPFPAGTSDAAVLLSITIQANLIMFKAALLDFTGAKYSLEDRVRWLGLYAAAQAGLLASRAAYIGQLVTWINTVSTYGAAYAASVAAQTDVNVVVAMKFDSSQFAADPAITLGAAISLGTQGPNTMLPYTASTPSRVLNTPFRPSTLRGTFVSYSISIQCTATLLAGQSGQVDLVCDASPTPATIVGSVSNSITLGVAITNTQIASLSYIVPPGYYVSLVSSGAATSSIVKQAEIAIG